MLIPDERVAEVVARLTDLPEADMLDMVELVQELEDEFGRETVTLAARFVEASRKHPSRKTSTQSDAMWDRDLDG